jgi:site-specific DNA-methyltransferase (adenine-specific)
MIEYFNEDCMVGMARYPDKHFDLAIVDPPYGIGNFNMKNGGGGKTKRNREQCGDYLDVTWNDHIPAREYFEQLIRVSRERIIWGANYFNCFENGGGALVWYKNMGHPNLSNCEIASLSFQKKVDFVHLNWASGFYRRMKEGEVIHPCQKPVALYKWLLTNYAKQGDLILDTHVGSASSLIACYDLGFDAVGFELDPDYYKASKQRLKDHMAQMRIEDMFNCISGEDDKPEQITLW